MSEEKKNIVLRSYAKMPKPEQDTLKEEFAEDTNNLYDYLLALGWIPLLLIIIEPLRTVWYLFLILTIIAFVLLQFLQMRMFAKWLLEKKNIRGYAEFLIKAELEDVPEAIDVDAHAPTIEDKFLHHSTPARNQEELEETPIE